MQVVATAAAFSHDLSVCVQMSVIEVNVLPLKRGVPPNRFRADSSGKKWTAEKVYVNLIRQHGEGTLIDCEGNIVRRDPQLELEAGLYTFSLKRLGARSSQTTLTGFCCGLVAVNCLQGMVNESWAEQTSFDLPPAQLHSVL